MPSSTAPTSAAADTLLDKIENRTAVIGVIGLGYVGLPLVLEFHRAGFATRGFDVDPEKVRALTAGESYIGHIGPERIRSLIEEERFRATADFAEVADCDALLICVPTPLTKNREPDMSYIVSTAKSIAPHLRKGQLVCLESTTYPGTTEEVLLPELEKGSGLRAGRDFFVAFSPEREDPNNTQHSTATIPKVVGGACPNSLRAAVALYDTVISRTVPVSSCGVAEATKLLENIFRSVNIALVNELKVVLDRMGIDVWEVIDAAKTKPFGYMAFYPGPGLGGHCIPIDPFYLTWKAREFEVATKFIELAGEVNTSMPYHVVTKTMEALNRHRKPLHGSRILLVGLAYKANVDDMRESPTLKLWELFERQGAEVAYHDPYIPEVKPNREHPEFTGRKSVPISEAGEFDAAVIVTAHANVDHAELLRLAPLVVDTRNACAGMEPNPSKYVKA